MHAFIVLCFVFQYQANRLAANINNINDYILVWGNVSEMTYFLSSGT